MYCNATNLHMYWKETVLMHFDFESKVLAHMVGGAT